MKINKKNPFHWLYLINFSLLVLLSIPLRPLLKAFRKKSLIVLYGHKLSGNLLSLKQKLDKDYPRVEAAFLTMDPDYYRKNKNKRFLFAQNPFHMAKVAGAECVISDHGLHSLVFYLKLTSMKFFDVWHGIPFQGFDDKDFRVQHCYDETWVASSLLAELYINRFGFDANKVAITGYARTDPLITHVETADEIRRRLGLMHTQGHKLVLFAPTWKQDDRHRSLFPFGIGGPNFMKNLASMCQKNGAMLLFRAHLNTRETLSILDDTIIPLPYADCPDTEAILQISDVLICDWSSIAFDYLLLDRPTLFLDVKAPFRKGFSLGPEYRFGPVVTSLAGLLTQLERSLTDPSGYWAEYSHHHTDIRKQVYGEYADGQSAKRCVERLAGALSISHH